MAKRLRNKIRSLAATPARPVEAGEFSSPGPRTPHWRLLLQALVILAAGLCIYWPALHGDWLWDDDALVTGNSRLHTLSGLEEIWFAAPTTDYWPLTWTLLWIEWHLWGNVSLGYHVVSLAFHLSSGFLLWRLFHRLGLRLGWFGGLLFVVHPLAVESVAWVAEIKNTFSLPFFLLSCNAWLDGEEKKPSGYLRSVLYYLAAMVAKTSTVMLPFVLLLFCWWKRGRVTWLELQRMMPYLAIALVLGSVTAYFQDAGQHNHLVPLGSFVSRLVGAGTAFFFYLGKFLLPVYLMPNYPRWAFHAPSVLQVLTLPALVALLGGLWTQRKGWGRHALFGLGFFLLNVLPVLGFVQMMYLSISQVADHLVYLPMIGLVGLVAAGWGRLEERIPSSLQLYGRVARSAALIVLTGLSHGYASFFIDQESLWSYTLRYNPQAWLAHNNLGVVLMQTDRLPEALEQFDQTLRIKPDYAEAHANLGDVLLQTGHAPQAIEQYQEALKLKPDLDGLHYNWGIALLQTGHAPEAVEQLQQATRLRPDFAEARNNLGNALLQTGRLPEAIEQFEQALKIEPRYAEAHNNLGIAFMQTGRLSEAIEHYEQALQINPDLADTHDNLGAALMQAGRLPEAIEQFEQTLRIQPDYVEARASLAKAQALLQAAPNPTSAKAR